MEINSKEYWEGRFSNGDWEKYDGDLQSAFFSHLFIREMPEWLRNDLNRNAWKLADYGCAEGGGTAVLGRNFPACSVTGYDFSEAAVNNARSKHSGCDFDVADMMGEISETDVIFSSNTLEHLRGPLVIMHRLIEASRKHTIFMLPFEDDFGFPEHINIFTAGAFPDACANHYLSFFKVIDCREQGIPYWPGKQVLLVYTNESFRNPSNYRLAEQYDACSKKYVEDAYQQKLDEKNLRKELAEQRMQLQEELNTALLQKQTVTEQLTVLQNERGNVLLEKQDAQKCLVEQQNKLSHALLEKQEVERRLAEQGNELSLALSQKQEAEKHLAERENELNNVLFQKQEAEKQLVSMKLALQQYQENRINTGYAVNNLINECNLMLTHKSFKLIHLLKRIRNQLLKGTWVERKKFWKWLVFRTKNTSDVDNRFKPLYSIITPLLELQNSLFSELPSFENISLPESNSCAVLDQSAEVSLDHNIALPGLVTGLPAKCLEQTYDKPDIIMFSVIDYDFRFQRPQHFAKRFAQNGHRVFYINANFINPECTKEIEPGLFTVSFMTTSCNAIYYNDSCDGFEDWLKGKMDALVQNYAIRDAILVLDYPNWIVCAEYLRNSYGFKMVADYMDDATGFLGTTTNTLKDNCVRMLRECDLVVPSSQFLYDIAKQYNDKLAIVRNGTEIEHFCRALSVETKGDRPVVGYYGAISHWFAWETVCYLAKHLPECDIVIIGAVTEYKDKLERYSNIKLLGEMDYKNLPEHLAYFDVCLIPFDTSTDLIKATNPVKFYEYLSAGKRIVATEIPELEPFRDKYVYMSNDNKQFLEYVKLCLEHKDTLASKEECIAFANANDWQHRYEAFAVACEQAVPKVSVIVITYNNLKLNQYCINSILNQTAYPNYELIVLDNLSTDGTVDYLKELEQENHPRLNIIFNGENSGFAGGNNKAIEASDGKYVVLLNNDTVVTRGWLTAMVKHMENDPLCGMVGAVTNSIGNESMIGAVYRNLNELARFAYAYTQLHNNEVYRGVDRLALFCTMIRRDILEQHSMLDPGYKVGMFEDDDFAMVVRQAGYHFYAAEDCFVHHVNNASFKKLHPEEYRKIFDTNRARYEKKWNTKWTMPKYREGVTYDINANVMTEPVEA